MPPEVARRAYSSRGVDISDGVMSMPASSSSPATNVSRTSPISPWESGSTGMMSTRPVRACAASGRVAYRVESARTYLPGRRSRLSWGLEDIKQRGNVLVLVDQDGLVRFDEPGRIGAHGCPGGQVIAVDHCSPQASGVVPRFR